jgi:SAM-dependent methyltransferase
MLGVAVALGYLQSSCSCRKSTFASMLRSRKDDTPWTRDVVCPHIADASGELHGTVVDVGTGAGVSLFCYQNHSHAIDRLVLVEPNEEFDVDMQKKIAEYGFTGKAEIRRSIPAELHGKADFAVSVHLLCSVEDEVLGSLLQDIGDALKPGTGKYIAIDHTTAPDETSWLRAAQRVAAPVWYIVGNGCKFVDIPALYAGDVATKARVAVEQESFEYPIVPLLLFIHPHAKMVGTSTKVPAAAAANGGGL